ncbi:MAG: NADH-quinone oxidoreductase subunit M [Akkermansiaceae bacterium]|nr:NADH-quinone oxidoreductase subunit M [Akkermansiaceae bacterium]
MLALLILLPLAAAIAILCGASARRTAVLATGASLILGFLFAALWSNNHDVGAMSLEVLSKPSISLSLGLFDGMSVTMMLLSVIVAFAAIFSGKCPEGREKLWYPSCLLITAGAIGAFLSTDLFFFYAFHELALIPTFLMIGILGTGDRKQAAWKITIYLAFGSIILLAGLLWMFSASGADNFQFTSLLAAEIPYDAQIGIAALLIIGFGTLVSLFPFHSWAAPAYASAPAPVSMLHAGVLKKFGLFGLLRLYPLVADGINYLIPWLIVMLLGNILWVGLVTINQKRLDTMLGNSSVMHMGYIFLAFAALAEKGPIANPIAIPAAVVLMFAHGISIAMLFGLSDRIKQATGTLELRELGGLAKAAPRLAFLFGLAAMASIGLPGLANFSGEIMVFLSGFKNWVPEEGLSPVQWGTILALWGLVISAVYMLRAFRKIFQGPVVPTTENADDLNCCDRMPAVILAVALLVVGLYPNSLLNFLTPSEPTNAPITQSDN